MSESRVGENDRGIDLERRALVVVCGAGACAMATAVAVPGAMFVGAQLKGSSSDVTHRAVVATIDALEVGVPARFAIVGDEVDGWTRAKNRKLGSVWLLKMRDLSVRAWSDVCPHLGCAIEASVDGAAAHFVCPCHGSTFDLDGERTGGPSPRSMDSLQVEVTSGGEVAVTLRRFRIGVAQKEPIG